MKEFSRYSSWRATFHSNAFVRQTNKRETCESNRKQKIRSQLTGVKIKAQKNKAIAISLNSIINDIEIALNFCLNQGCPICGSFKVLVRPRDIFLFSGYNEGYEEEFRKIPEKHLGWKSINKRRF